ncbi:MAG: exopolysaccharide biosynthesis polyprenyl glycosylphosphotransferase, partial [Acidobacteria bacterium]|nr:exopolysaccharide biosynthesis polyprenyl glycosylphosphotransferase [Acidobacteriota bacterium]
MVRRHNRLLVAFHVLADMGAGITAFALAYFVRFETGLIAAPKGQPPFSQYVDVLPFIAVIVPIAFQLQGLYRLRRGRSRIDDFFNVFVGSIIAVVLGVVSTLYFQAYYVPDELKDRGAYEVSQAVWALFLVLNVVLTFLSRNIVREALERRWAAGIGLRRILIAGSSELGRMVADKILEHRELGYQIVGFVDDRAGGDHLGYRGLPLLGRLADTAEIASRERIDHLYVALPLEEHMKLLDLVESTSREGVDVRVVPDLLQFIALRARLEDLDGVPVINLNDVPLQGFNSLVKRALDFAFSLSALTVMAVPGLIIAWLVKRSSPGPVFYQQQRMGLDGRRFTVYKFRTMVVDAEEDTGPIWADEDDARATRIGAWLRRHDFDEWPQFWNVFKGEMSIVGPRPERPFFVEQFKHRIPQYMLRHKVKAGITG